jgi:hypothetical protein
MKPVPGGVINVFLGFARISPFEVTIPTEILFAEPSIPKIKISFYIISDFLINLKLIIPMPGKKKFPLIFNYFGILLKANI